jgi:fructose-bisphosphate aldolase, class II
VPIATPEQYQEMLDTAHAEGFAYPAINVSSSQTLNAALRGLSESRSDGIIQITTGAAGYLASASGDMAAGAHAFALYARRVAEDVPILVALHTDHCRPDDVDRFLRPLLAATAARRLDSEPPLFNSHMFDGSELPLAENLQRSRQLLDQAAELDVVMEFEIGIVGGEEDGIDHRGAYSARLYSSPADAVATAGALGTGESGRYLLAATFGNVHGHYAPGSVRLRPELLGDLQHAIRNGSGRQFDFVFHGGSGSTLAEIGVAVSYGVVKLNIDTDMQHAFSSAIERHFSTTTEAAPSAMGIDKRIYDPRAWGRKAEADMALLVAKYAFGLGAAGRTLGSR